MDVDVESRSLLLGVGVEKEGANCSGVAREDIEYDRSNRSKEIDFVGLAKVEPPSDFGVLTLSSPFLTLESAAQACKQDCTGVNNSEK